MRMLSLTLFKRSAILMAKKRLGVGKLSLPNLGERATLPVSFFIALVGCFQSFQRWYNFALLTLKTKTMDTHNQICYTGK